MLHINCAMVRFQACIGIGAAGAATYAHMHFVSASRALHKACSEPKMLSLLGMGCQSYQQSTCLPNAPALHSDYVLQGLVHVFVHPSHPACEYQLPASVAKVSAHSMHLHVRYHA